jgi:hypothetical protein
MPLSFTVQGPQPKFDGRRAFQGRPQLSDTDREILRQGRRDGIRICHEAGQTVFVCGAKKLRRQTILRLMQLGYLIPASDGLFGGDTAQTLLINITR